MEENLRSQRLADKKSRGRHRYPVVKVAEYPAESVQDTGTQLIPSPNVQERKEEARQVRLRHEQESQRIRQEREQRKQSKCTNENE